LTLNPQFRFARGYATNDSQSTVSFTVLPADDQPIYILLQSDQLVGSVNGGPNSCGSWFPNPWSLPDFDPLYVIEECNVNLPPRTVSGWFEDGEEIIGKTKLLYIDDVEANIPLTFLIHSSWAPDPFNILTITYQNTSFDLGIKNIKLQLLIIF
jgi:hypothetical protein